MYDSTAIQIRQPEREMISDAISLFLASGKTITKLSHIERAPEKATSWNTSVSRKRNARREYLATEAKIAERGKALALIGLQASQAMRQMRPTYPSITTQQLEQIAAKYGYAYSSTERGRP